MAKLISPLKPEQAQVLLKDMVIASVVVNDYHVHIKFVDNTGITIKANQNSNCSDCATMQYDLWDYNI